MIKGVGTDMVNSQRIAAVLSRQQKRFSDRVLAVNERPAFSAHHNQTRFLAKRWAVKEATAKALGCGIGQGAKLHDITLGHSEQGAPILQLTGDALATAHAIGAREWYVSLTDEDHYVLAFVVLT